jgi:hypothetical protein
MRVFVGKCSEWAGRARPGPPLVCASEGGAARRPAGRATKNTQFRPLGPTAAAGECVHLCGCNSRCQVFVPPSVPPCRLSPQTGFLCLDFGRAGRPRPQGGAPGRAGAGNQRLRIACRVKCGPGPGAFRVIGNFFHKNYD